MLFSTHSKNKYFKTQFRIFIFFIIFLNIVSCKRNQSKTVTQTEPTQSNDTNKMDFIFFLLLTF